MMELHTAHRKLASATTMLREQVDEIAAFADEFIGGTHRVAPRVELERYADLCADIEYAIAEHTQARQAFLKAIRGDAG